nr:DUF3710 domain-containing protein [Tessaracoccus coleopterorum]
MAPEIREEIIKATQQQKGQIAIVNGPFGTELRRAMPVTDPNGNPAMHVSRTWMVSGPAGCCAACCSARPPSSPRTPMRRWRCSSSSATSSSVADPSPPHRAACCP